MRNCSNEIYREVYESQTGGGGDFDEKKREMSKEWQREYSR